MNIVAWFIFVMAAMLEVGGDAIIRRGLRGHRTGLVLAGCATLCGYGLLVNTVKWDFSKLLGIYVGFFALVSVLSGCVVFGEKIPSSTWLGMVLIVAGSLVIQFGRR
jgi:drug/metabolite transporter superfamily protein YnfA